jgi:hypothetical protein
MWPDTSCNVIKVKVAEVSVPIGYHVTLSTPPPSILKLWAASTNNTVELTARVVCYFIAN